MLFSFGYGEEVFFVEWVVKEVYEFFMKFRVLIMYCIIVIEVKM